MSNRNLPVDASGAGIQTDNDTPEAETNWEEAPVIDNTGNATVRDFDIASDDHPLVDYAGQDAIKTDIQGGGEFVSEEIYEDDSKFVREFLQNQESAVIRDCKMKVQQSDEYEDGWLKQIIWINAETGEAVEKTDEVDADTIALDIPRPIDEVIEAARSLGYDPTIEWDVYRDERKIVTKDNGIGMTPKEFWEAFKAPFSSGSGVDGETGGKFGIGSNTVEKVHGAEGAALVMTRSDRPGNYEGYQAYSYRGGATATPGDVEDGFTGTIFEIPVCDDFNLTNLQDHIEQYTDKLSIPVLYREHNAGSTPIEEEYPATNFVESFDQTPVVIDRPGEFTAVAGPDVCPRTTYSEPDSPDTYLVSMKIDRNTRASLSTLWDVVIQIHDEQGRIVMGPHRGFYAHKGSVYETGQTVNKIAEVHEDDIVLPVPTGDRDRLKKTDTAKEFFYFVGDLVTKEAHRGTAETVAKMKQAANVGNHVGVALDSHDEWKLFKRLVNKHGPHDPENRRRKFRSYMNDVDVFPDMDDDTLNKIHSLFKTVELCDKGAGRSSQKRSRTEKCFGEILSKYDSDNIFMAASTGGKFSTRFKVIENTDSDNTVVVINGASRYERYQEEFGFRILKEVPTTHADDGESHQYDVPEHIHETETRKAQKNTGKSDELLSRSLKLRTNTDNTAIDERLTIEAAKNRLEKAKCFGGHQKLMLFTRGNGENISDHYDMAQYAAIACVSKEELAELEDYDNVVSYEEYVTWSENTLIATEDGAKTPEELYTDDRMVILLYRRRSRGDPIERDEARFLMDENETLRELYCNDVRDQCNWAKMLDGFDGGYHGDDVGEVPDIAKDDTLFAVAGNRVLNRAQYAMDQLGDGTHNSRNIVGLRLGRSPNKNTPIRWKTLDEGKSTLKLKADTPNWNNNSAVYNLISDRDSIKAQIYLGFHDRGIDPTHVDETELRKMIANGI